MVVVDVVVEVEVVKVVEVKVVVEVVGKKAQKNILCATSGGDALQIAGYKVPTNTHNMSIVTTMLITPPMIASIEPCPFIIKSPFLPFF